MPIRGEVQVRPKEALCEEAQTRRRTDRAKKESGTKGTKDNNKPYDQHQGNAAQEANTEASAEATQSKLEARSRDILRLRRGDPAAEKEDLNPGIQVKAGDQSKRDGRADGQEK